MRKFIITIALALLVTGGSRMNEPIRFAVSDIGMNSDVAHGTQFGDSASSAQLTETR
jgi:hypothetical protein